LKKNRSFFSVTFHHFLIAIIRTSSGLQHLSQFVGRLGTAVLNVRNPPLDRIEK
jgi:hypothetical protein